MRRHTPPHHDPFCEVAARMILRIVGGGGEAEEEEDSRRAPGRRSSRVWKVVSPHKRNQGAAVLWVFVPELLQVPLVVLDCPWPDVEQCAKRKAGGGQ